MGELTKTNMRKALIKPIPQWWSFLCFCSLSLTSGFLTRISNNSYEILRNLVVVKESSTLNTRHLK